MRLSPVLADLGTYPFVRIEDAKRRLAAQGVSFVDFGVGDPREPVEPFIRQALVESVEERMGYPLAQGLPELRRAIADWCARRFGVALDPDTEVIPTLGSKEAIFSLAQVALDVVGGKDVVVVTEPGYPVQGRGALFAGGRVVKAPLLERNGFLPDLDAIGPETWARVAVFWVNYPNNPTGTVAPLSFFERLAGLAVEHDFLLASDEAYTELYFGEPPPSALQLASRRNVAAFNTLSKRSSMTGYRSGFVAGDPELIGALRAFRPTVGTAPQEFVQRAAIAAWDDEAHVERTREAYGRKREILLEALGETRIRVAGSEATMYLWLEVPGGGSSEAFATGLLEHGIVVAPGAFFGPAGEGYVRIALVPTEDECRSAAAILREVL
jgi:succinyldiaminopimelate transaminase